MKLINKVLMSNPEVDSFIKFQHISRSTRALMRKTRDKIIVMVRILMSIPLRSYEIADFPFIEVDTAVSSLVP